MKDIEGKALINKASSAIRSAARLSQEDRVEIYNEIERALGEMVSDCSPDPATHPQLVPIGRLHANDYNPNKVASVELDLLRQSMEADGITMAVVVMQEPNGSFVVIDGFHRHSVASGRLGREYIPCSVIDRPLADRMASTVRHNRARGKHQVDLMGVLVKQMMDLGWTDDRIANALGMSEEEYLRLRQIVGAARMLAAEDYTRSWSVMGDGQPEDKEPK